MNDPRATGRLRHELRTPVNHILGYAELLIEDAEDANRGDRGAILEGVRAAGQRALNLVDRIATPGGDEVLELARRLTTELEGIAAACGVLAEGAAEGADPAGFLNDVARIRTACDRLAGLLAQVRPADTAPEVAA